MNRKLTGRLVSCALLAATLILAPAIFTGGIVLPACAQTSAATAVEKPADYSQAEEHARAVGKELLARGIPGLAVAVAVDGKIVYSEGFGYADLEERVPVWPTTKFRIGSVSKPLTSVALVVLVEQGKLELDAPVQKYVPTF